MLQPLPTQDQLPSVPTRPGIQASWRLMTHSVQPTLRPCCFNGGDCFHFSSPKKHLACVNCGIHYQLGVHKGTYLCALCFGAVKQLQQSYWCNCAGYQYDMARYWEEWLEWLGACHILSPSHLLLLPYQWFCYT